MKVRMRLLVLVVVLFTFVAITSSVSASHSWGNYHWARTSNPFTLSLGDNMSGVWDAHLVTASNDWTQSSVLNTVIVAGRTRQRQCRPTTGRIEVCNYTYGNNGWLGLAQIWVSGSHITRGTAKMNDTYFNTAQYNTPAWRQLVVCQEIAHDFGLDHQDENFDNGNLGSCMDYTSDPDGPPSNEHPNAHDFAQLETIYAHLDSTSTVGQSVAEAAEPPGFAQGNFENPGEWGQLVRSQGRTAIYERDFGGGHKVITFVIWA